MRRSEKNRLMRCLTTAMAMPAGVVFLVCSLAVAAPTDVHQLIERQAQIGSTLARIAKGMDAENPAEQRIRAVLYSLSVSETVKAVHALEQIARAPSPAAAKDEVARLAASQDRIIEIIERVLGIIERLHEEAATPVAEEEGSDLPDDVNDQLRDLADAIKNFCEEQKKVVDATTSLAKTNVEDFTPEQEQQLKQLEAAEQDWAAFLKEAHADLSKLHEQDFSNPSLLKELVEIYTEIEMAADALSQKATEIAVPHEESGLEKAEALEFNLERWLTDTPDRDRWQMEEPLQDYEIPMAELPTELQDIVGDLMEEEEDLLEDIEDATSGWMDSLDKGAGWDAMDGPISNMSARGVTGNRLPNTSEIGGRSGEGRTGKSGGEFVEESAVGKGGRRTPTRLTADPFEKGVVDDRSPDSGGGSTGGGKISGAGSEGLEGPIPPEISQKMKALAGRQAELHNKAERIELAFKVMGYPTEPIENSVRAMKEMEDALLRARYGAVSRQRHVLLKNLEDTRSFLVGEARVQRDLTVNLPPELQKEMRDGMGDPSPKEYEQLLRAYFKALATPP